MTFTKHMMLATLLCAGSLAAEAGCWAAPHQEKGKNTSVHGAVRLDGPPLNKPVYPFYTLCLVQVDGTRPAQCFWFLQQSPTAGLDERIEPNDTVFASLSSPVLRNFVAHLPQGTRIVHSGINYTGPDPTMKVGSENEPGLQDFIKFCRTQKIDFVIGYSF